MTHNDSGTLGQEVVLQNFEAASSSVIVAPYLTN